MSAHKTRRMVLRICMLMVLLGAGLDAGCAPAQKGDSDWAASWRAEPLLPSRRFNENAVVDDKTGHLRGDSGYFLYLLTDAVGLDSSSCQSFLKTLHKHPRGSKKDRSIGHCWLILEGPDSLIECGHTGEFGIENATYYRGVSQRIAANHPNPIAYLFEPMPDGQFHRGPGTHRPTFVLRLSITSQQHARIYDYIDHYRYDTFSLVEHDCASFVVGAASLAGLNLAAKIRLTIPPTVMFRGRALRLWTDPKYRTLVVGSPDLLEAYLRTLADEGIGEDATAWYFE